MRASVFEWRHPLLLHRIIFAVTLLTYLIDPDDIVWRFIRNNASGVRETERLIFGVATLVAGIAAGLCTAVQADWRPVALLPSARDGLHRAEDLGRIGDLLYAVALATLLPLSGAIFLVVAESIRLGRLAGRMSEAGLTPRKALAASKPAIDLSSGTVCNPRWTTALWLESMKWGFFASLIVFTITLRDSLVEYLIGLSFLLSVVANLKSARKTRAVLPVCTP